MLCDLFALSLSGAAMAVGALAVPEISARAYPAPQIQVVRAIDSPAGSLDGTTTGAVIGAVAGKPAGADIGASPQRRVIHPSQHVRDYVLQHRTPSVLLDSETAVGVILPEFVKLYPIPDYHYRFAYVNRVPVLVDPTTRQIVHMFRGD